MAPPLLPPELQLLVIHHSVTAPSLTDYSARYGTLRRYSLVSRAWRAWAQAELFRSVVLPDRTSARVLAQVLEQRSELGEGVREMRMGTISVDAPKQSAAGSKLKVLMTACGQLRELRIVTVKRIDLKDLAPVSSSLTSLFLSNCTITALQSFPTSLSWPHVCWMCVLDTKIYDAYSHFTTTAFPSVSALSWSHNEVYEHQRQVDDVQPPFLDSPALKSLSISSSIPPSLVSSQSIFLDCVIGKFTARALPHLPAYLRTLRLGHSAMINPAVIANEVGSLIATLRKGRAVARTWEELRVPLRWTQCGRWGEVEREASELGIRLVEEEGMAEDYLRGKREVAFENEEFDEGFWAVVRMVERRFKAQERS